jgi:hypothetical protein
LPDNKILREAVDVYVQTVHNGGKAEFMKVLKMNDAGEYETVYEEKGEDYVPGQETATVGNSDEYPEGDVSIHSHPTVVISGNGQATFHDARKRSAGYLKDEGVFEKYDLNIIVGKGGEIDYESYKAVKQDYRQDVMCFYNSTDATPFAEVGISAIQKIVNSKTKTESKTYEKYLKNKKP